MSLGNGAARSPVPPAGIYVPCVTFFNPDETLDLESIKAHVLRLAQSGAGIVLQGSNGEAFHLDNDERQTIISTVRKHLDANGFKDKPIIAGMGAQSRAGTVKLAKEAKSAGAGFGLCLPASYWPGAMTKQVILDYFYGVADESPLPLLIYNFPLVCNGVMIDSDTMLELAKHPNIVGCKLTCGHIGNLHRIASHTKPDDFSVMGGKGEFLLHGLIGGSQGCIAALANVAPKAHIALMQAFQKGDYTRAKQIQDILSDADLVQQKLGISGLKLAVSSYFGYGSGRARSPLPMGDEAKFASLRGPMDKLVELEKSL